MKVQLLLGVLSAFGSLAVAADNKQALMVSDVTASATAPYSLVQTTIYKDATKADGAAPLITRSQLGVVGGSNTKSGLLNVNIELPTPPVKLETYSAPALLNKVGQIVSSVGTAAVQPEVAAVGAAISTASAIADIGVSIAEDQLSKMYGTQQIKINLLEIVPTEFYTIKTETNKIEVTEKLIAYLPKYQQALKEYLSAFATWSNLEAGYAKRVAELARLKGQQYKDFLRGLKAIDANSIQPALKLKNQKQTAFANMRPPYRIAIMASPDDPDNTCTRGSGAWQFNIIYYLGSKQTNQIGVKYCVPNPKEKQLISLEVMANAINYNSGLNSSLQKFLAGGVKVTPDSNISFTNPTGVYNWFTEMITSQTGGDITGFLLPFDIYALRADAEKAYQEKQDAKTKQQLDMLDKLTPQITGAVTGLKDAAAKKAADALAKKEAAATEAALGSKTQAAEEKSAATPAVVEAAEKLEATAEAAGVRPPAATPSILATITGALNSPASTTLLKAGTDIITQKVKNSGNTAPAA